VQKLMPAVLKSHHPVTDTVDEYSACYGYLGAALHAGVVKLRHSQSSTTTAAQAFSQSHPATVTASALPFLQVTSCFSL